MTNSQQPQALHGLEEVNNVIGGGFIIAVDGPSGTGKSTVCRRLAQAAKAKYLDTGAMYRVATLHVLRQGIDVDHADSVEQIIAATADLPMEVNNDPSSTEVLLNGEDVSTEIRGKEVTTHVSAVSAIPEVRVNLVAKQRELALDAGRCVVEGRDIATAVLPDAPVKVFMTASAAVRAQRRYDQDIAAGREADYDAVLADVQRRDEADSTRAVSPLRPSEDAVLLDSSDMDIEQVLTRLAELAKESGETPVSMDSKGSDEPADADERLDDLQFRTTDGAVIGQYAPEEHAQTSVPDYEEDIPDFADADDFDLLTADEENTDWDAVEEAFGAFAEPDMEEESLCTVAIVGLSLIHI